MIPIAHKSESETTANTTGSGKNSTVDHAAVYINGPKYPNCHYYTIADYHSAYESGKLTPTAVAEALLGLVPKHKVAFLDVKNDKVLAAAEASTQRYKDGKARSMMDGVPVSVKGMLAMLFIQFYLNFGPHLHTLLYFSRQSSVKGGINDLYSRT